jgi:uncharacterized membrane protein SpoIIM required for sporulation
MFFFSFVSFSLNSVLYVFNNNKNLINNINRVMRTKKSNYKNNNNNNNYEFFFTILRMDLDIPFYCYYFS